MSGVDARLCFVGVAECGGRVKIKVGVSATARVISVVSGVSSTAATLQF